MPPRRGRRPPGAPLSARALPLRAGRGGGDAPVRVLVDGRNVQHALARAAGASDFPTAALVARLRAAFEPSTQVELILDGHAGGSPQGRVAPGLSVVFTRSATADFVIGERVTEAFRALGPVGAWSIVVITDDREVRDHARRAGVRVEGTAWLVGRMAGGAGGPGRGAPGTAIGGGRRTPRAATPDGAND